MTWLAKNKIFNCNSHTHLLGLPFTIFLNFILVTCLHFCMSACVFVIQSHRICQYWSHHICSLHVLFNFFFFFFFFFSWYSLLIQLIKGWGKSPQGGMENFADFLFFFKLGVEIWGGVSLTLLTFFKAKKTFCKS